MQICNKNVYKLLYLTTLFISAKLLKADTHNSTTGVRNGVLIVVWHVGAEWRIYVQETLAILISDNVLSPVVDLIVTRPTAS